MTLHRPRRHKQPTDSRAPTARARSRLSARQRARVQSARAPPRVCPPCPRPAPLARRTCYVTQRARVCTAATRVGGWMTRRHRRRRWHCAPPHPPPPRPKRRARGHHRPRRSLPPPYARPSNIDVKNTRRRDRCAVWWWSAAAPSRRRCHLASARRRHHRTPPSPRATPPPPPPPPPLSLFLVSVVPVVARARCGLRRVSGPVALSSVVTMTIIAIQISALGVIFVVCVVVSRARQI